MKETLGAITTPFYIAQYNTSFVLQKAVIQSKLMSKVSKFISLMTCHHCHQNDMSLYHPFIIAQAKTAKCLRNCVMMTEDTEMLFLYGISH